MGAGMDKTNIVSNWEQPEKWDSENNSTDARTWCGLIVDGLPDIMLEDFSIEYKGTFHWKGETYRGSVMNIMMVDTTNGLVRRVESKGSNCIGIFFTSHNGEVVELGKQFKEGKSPLSNCVNQPLKPAAQISFTDNDIYTQALINQVRGSWLDNSVPANTIIQRNRVLTINNL